MLALAHLLLGLLVGGIVNLFSTELAARRQLGTPEWRQARAAAGRWRFTLQFWKQTAAGRAWQLRNLLVWLFYSLLGLAAGAWQADLRLPYELSVAVLGYLGVVTVMDIEHKVILYPVVASGLLLATGSGWWLRGWGATLMGGLAGFVLMYALYWLGERLYQGLARARGEPATEIALGFGDVNLAALLGLWLGWPGVLAGLFLAIFLGGGYSLAYLVIQSVRRRYSAFTALPYGPFLVAALVWLLFVRPLLLAG